MNMQYGYGPPSARQEVPLYSSGWVQVTSARFIVGSQTYPVANITSISPFTIGAKRAGPIAFAGILFFFMLFAGLAGAGGIAFIMGLCMAAAIAWAVLQKTEHVLMISTSGMQVRALVSKDLAFIHAVVSSLNQAIAMR